MASADDNASFQIVGNELRSNTVFQSRTKSSYTVRVRTTDSGNLLTEQSFTITVVSVNQPPATIVLSTARLAELLPDDTFFGTLTSDDPDGPGTTTCSPPALDLDDLASNDRFFEDARGLSEACSESDWRRLAQRFADTAHVGEPFNCEAPGRSRGHPSIDTTRPDVARPLNASMRIGTHQHHRPDRIDGNQGTVLPDTAQPGIG